MTREDAIRRLNGEYDQKQVRHLTELRAREAEIAAKSPEIWQLVSARAALPAASLKLAMSDRKNARAIADKMREEGLRLNREIRAKLVDEGYPSDFLSMQYDCPVCRDSGYVGDGVPARACACYEKRLRELMRESDGVAAFDTQNFAAFDETRIPDEPIKEGGVSQRAYTLRLRDLCEEYAHLYPNTVKPNLILMGEAGLGKSFLLNCIAERVESRGYAATLITAYKLFEVMRERHYHMDADEGEFERLSNCELLLIDDLGCEPMLKNITQEYLFILLNDRLLKNRYTVIATNLTPPLLKERYGERIMSRLSDTKAWDHCRLMGKDLRRA